jgi:hypothetical protein
MHVRPISIPRSTSPHAAAQAQQHRRARLRTHISMHTMALTNMSCRHSRAHRHANASGTPAAPTSSVFLAATSAPCCSSVCTTAACPAREARCKLVLPSWRAGVRSAAGPQRQERPRQAATLSRAGHPALRTRTSTSTLQQGVVWVHTSPCIPWRPQTCMHGDVHRNANASGTPAAPTLFVAATSAPCCSSDCTTAACPDWEAECKLVHPSWRAGVRSAAGPQRQERPRQAATLSRAGHPALRTRTSASTLQQGVAWAPSRAIHPPRQCMRTWP